MESKEIVITRVFDAPRELLWKAWTEPEHVEKWFGPEGFDTRVDELDFREGGKSRYVMIDPDGKEYPSEGTFSEIVEGERIVTTDEFGDDFDSDDMELPQGKMVLTVLFEDVGEKTRLTLRVMHDTAEDREKHEKMGVMEGWNSSLDKLEKHLEGL